MSGRLAASGLALALAAGLTAAAQSDQPPLRVEVASGEESLVPIRLQGHDGEPLELVFEGPYAADGFQMELVDETGGAVHRLRLDAQAARLRVTAPPECELRRQRAVLAVDSPSTERSVALAFEVVASPSLSSCGAAVSLRWLGSALTVLFSGLTAFTAILLVTMAWQSRFLPLDKLAGRLRKGPGLDGDIATQNRLRACLPWWRRGWCWLRFGIGRTQYREAVVLHLRDGLRASPIDEQKIGHEAWTGNLFAVATRNGFKIVGYPDERGLFEGGLRPTGGSRAGAHETLPPGRHRLTDGRQVWEIDLGGM